MTTGNHAPTQVKRHRRLSRTDWGTLQSGIERDRRALPAASPRRVPTMPQLRILSDSTLTTGAGDGGRSRAAPTGAGDGVEESTR
jgi:hypothetical protein